MEDIRIGYALVIACNDCSRSALQTDGIGAFGRRSFHAERNDRCAVSCSRSFIRRHGECQLTCDSIIQLRIEAVCSACCKRVCNIGKFGDIKREFHSACDCIVFDGVIHLNRVTGLNLRNIIIAFQFIFNARGNQIEDNIAVCRSSVCLESRKGREKRGCSQAQGGHNGNEFLHFIPFLDYVRRISPAHIKPSSCVIKSGF